MSKIRLEKLTKSFGKLQVLKGVDAPFEPGQVVAVVGPNASGKTTLIKCILGMVLPGSGNIYVNEKSILKDVDYKRGIGYMPQIGRYPDNMSVGQLFRMMKDIRNQPETRLDEELIEGFGLGQIFQKPMRTLSGGTRQKVSAALAFLFDPEILILDEPTAGLDPLSAEILKEKIRSSGKKGKLILITSHIMNEVDELADSVIYLMEGTVKFHEGVEGIKRLSGEDRLGKALSQLIKENHHV